jgi:hypothetical protein
VNERSLALDALERIAQHEKECGERWGEAVVELKELRKATDSHAARWEKLAWLVITTTVGSVVAVWINHIG